MLVTTSDFTPPARELARKAGVELVTGQDLVRLALAHALGKASPVVTDEPVARGAPSSAGSPASPSLWRMPDHAPERQHRRPAARCLTCSQPVSHGVVRYCQQHAARFGGAVYCMPCQQHFSTATA